MEDYQMYDPCPHCGAQESFRQTVVQQETVAVEDGEIVDIHPDGSTYTVHELFCTECDRLITRENPPSVDSERWSELHIGREGVSVSLYDGVDQVDVVDEWWSPWADIFSDGMTDEAWLAVSNALSYVESEKVVLQE